jgi:iron-regulated transporter 1
MVGLQGIAIMASGLVVLTAAANHTVKFVDSPLFIVLLLLSMMERLTAILSELAIERDWVTQLSGKDNALALASSNAMLRRTDLSCELVGSLAFGWLYSTAGLFISVAAATFLALISLPAQLISIFRIAKMVPEAMVHGREDAEVAMFNPLPWKTFFKTTTTSSENNSNDENLIKTPPKAKVSLLQRIKTQSMHAVDGWRAYFRQPILFSSLTFVLLFFNVALSPGGLITAFLTAKGLDGKGMAIFRGGCAVMGFTGTWVGRRLIQRYGLLGAGQRALLIQAVFLGLATLAYAAFLSAPVIADGASAIVATPASIGLIIFSCAVVLSRIGMWSFDMVNAQLFQQNVSQREVASASAAEMALCSFSELFMLGLAAYVIGPASFKTLIYVSFAAVLAGNVLFSWWGVKQEEGEEAIAAAA